MAIKLQTLLNHAKENMGSGMNPVVNETILEVVKLAYEAGIFVQITAGYRIFREQHELYERSRTNKSKPIVTYARGGNPCITMALQSILSSLVITASGHCGQRTKSGQGWQP